jgi:hypothetical protein
VGQMPPPLTLGTDFSYSAQSVCIKCNGHGKGNDYNEELRTSAGCVPVCSRNRVANDRGVLKL